MHNKVAAIQIKNALLYGALREKTSAINIKDIQDAMEIQRKLNTGSASDRIGSEVEQARRAVALLGTGTGALLGGGLTLGNLAHLAKGGVGSKALLALATLGGAGAGGAAGNILGRGLGIAAGGIDGALVSIPGIRDVADYLTQPIIDRD